LSRKPDMPQSEQKYQAILLALLLFCAPLNTSAASYSRDNIFIEMMRTMLEIMGVIDDDNDYYNQPYPSYNHFPSFYYPGLASQGMGNPWQSMPQALAWQPMLSGGYPGMPGLNPIPGYPASGAVIPYMPGYKPGKSPGYKPHWIEGRWVASDGMVMEVRQGEVKMFYRHAPDQVRSGIIRLKEHWLGIYFPSQQFARQYEFAYKDDRLALRDIDGNLMLFRRMTDWAIPLQGY
jgi:hypothetical protein